MTTPDSGWSRRRAMAAMGLPMALPQTAGLAAGGGDRNSSTAAVVSPIAFGARGDGDADDTAAFQRTVDRLAAEGGGTMALPAGVFRTTTVYFPYEPVTIGVIGAGIGRTIWEMADPHRPIISIDPSKPPRRSLGTRFAHFSVRAHSAGRAEQQDQIAIDCVGFSDATFSHLQFLSNGRGSVGTWFHTAAHPHLTYHQRFSNLLCQKNVGPGCIIRATNHGSPLSNTNLVSVEKFWIYANSNMNVAFDLLNVTGYTVRQGLIESSGLDGIKLGNAGLIEQVWIEDVSRTPILFSASKTATSSHNTLNNVYLSGYSGEVLIPLGSSNNVLANVTGGDFFIRRESPLDGNVVINSGRPRGLPKATPFAGPDARLRAIQSYRSSGLGERWNLFYEMTAATGGTIGLRIHPPEGSFITGVQVSALDPGTGKPHPTAVGWPVGDVFVTAPGGQAVSLVIQLTLE